LTGKRLTVEGGGALLGRGCPSAKQRWGQSESREKNNESREDPSICPYHAGATQASLAIEGQKTEKAWFRLEGKKDEGGDKEFIRRREKYPP